MIHWKRPDFISIKHTKTITHVLQDCGLQLNDEEGHRCYPAGWTPAVPPMPPAPVKNPSTDPPAPELPATRHWTVNTRLTLNMNEEREEIKTEGSVLPLNNKRVWSCPFDHGFPLVWSPFDQPGRLLLLFHPSSRHRGVWARCLQHCHRGSEGDPCLFFLLNAKQQHWTYRLRYDFLCLHRKSCVDYCLWRAPFLSPARYLCQAALGL